MIDEYKCPECGYKFTDDDIDIMAEDLMFAENTVCIFPCSNCKIDLEAVHVITGGDEGCVLIKYKGNKTPTKPKQIPNLVIDGMDYTTAELL